MIGGWVIGSAIDWILAVCVECSADFEMDKVGAMPQAVIIQETRFAQQETLSGGRLLLWVGGVKMKSNGGPGVETTLDFDDALV